MGFAFCCLHPKFTTTDSCSDGAFCVGPLETCLTQLGYVSSEVESSMHAESHTPRISTSVFFRSTGRVMRSFLSVTYAAALYRGVCSG